MRGSRRPSSPAARKTFQQLKFQVPIEDLLLFYGWDGNDFNKGWGGWVNIRCPFHDDRNPSARYSPIKDRFDCFACDIHGDIFDVVGEVEGLDVGDAKRWIETNLLS